MEWDVRAYLALVAIIISVVTGIIIPLAKYFIHKYYLKAKITVIPFSKTTFLYNSSGSYIKMKFSLDCRNQDVVVNNIKVAISTNRKTGKSETLSLDWDNFEPAAYTWVGSSMSNSINSMAFARPIKVVKNSVEPFIVEFANSSQDALNGLSALREKRRNSVYAVHDEKQKEASQENNWFDWKLSEVVVDTFRKSDDYTQLQNAYSNYLFWEAGEYAIELTINYNDNQIITEHYVVTIDSTDEVNMRENVDSIIFGAYKSEQNLALSFNALYKDLTK